MQPKRLVCRYTSSNNMQSLPIRMAALPIGIDCRIPEYDRLTSIISNFRCPDNAARGKPIATARTPPAQKVGNPTPDHNCRSRVAGQRNRVWRWPSSLSLLLQWREGASAVCDASASHGRRRRAKSESGRTGLIPVRPHPIASGFLALNDRRAPVSPSASAPSGSRCREPAPTRRDDRARPSR